MLLHLSVTPGLTSSMASHCFQSLALFFQAGAAFAGGLFGVAGVNGDAALTGMAPVRAVSILIKQRSILASVILICRITSGVSVIGPAGLGAAAMGAAAGGWLGPCAWKTRADGNPLLFARSVSRSLKLRRSPWSQSRWPSCWRSPHRSAWRSRLRS